MQSSGFLSRVFVLSIFVLLTACGSRSQLEVQTICAAHRLSYACEYAAIHTLKMPSAKANDPNDLNFEEYFALWAHRELRTDRDEGNCVIPPRFPSKTLLQDATSFGQKLGPTVNTEQRALDYAFVTVRKMCRAHAAGAVNKWSASLRTKSAVKIQN